MTSLTSPVRLHSPDVGEHVQRSGNRDLPHSSLSPRLPRLHVLRLATATAARYNTPAGVADSGACPPSPQQLTCGTPGNGNTGLQAVTSYILSPDILPEAAKTPYPGADNQRSFALVE